ncbi:MAG: hypothetical protein MUO77_16050 [Anaerolineales bacterium]|nr:hypothetical protein [Anaerolineales bacterium]
MCKLCADVRERQLRDNDFAPAAQGKMQILFLNCQPLGHRGISGKSDYTVFADWMLSLLKRSVRDNFANSPGIWYLLKKMGQPQNYYARYAENGSKTGFLNSIPKTWDAGNNEPRFGNNCPLNNAQHIYIIARFVPTGNPSSSSSKTVMV